jgi:hypothetical protein
MKTSAHYHIGIDAHKRISQVHVLADDGSTTWKGRIEGGDPVAFDALVRMPGGRCNRQSTPLRNCISGLGRTIQVGGPP